MVLPAFEKVGVALAQDEPTDSSGSLIVLNLYGELVEIRTRFFCPSGYRILDMLNREDGTGAERNAFIDLIDMDTKEETHLRKETIQFVAVDDAGAGRGFSSDPVHRQFPYVEKDPVKVNIQLKSYRLVGQAYQVKNRALKALLAENSTFMPLTGVTIFRGFQPLCEKPFVAVNKKQIISLKKDLISS